ncbi:MAG TPA: PhoH family protein, partial [Paraburkholderia sp.]|nr:PhoH family protein [Paraburkholderia sp.]
MPLPTPPSKLGNLLPPEEYKARAKTSRSTRKAAGENDAADVASELANDVAAYGAASVAEPMTEAANAATTLRTVPLPSASAELAA